MDAPLEVAIIGAGFSGLAMAQGLLDAGISQFEILEKAAAAGGTWRENTYPGAACDVPSHLYSLSFAPNPDWRRVFSRQPELQDYLLELSARIGARVPIRFGWQLRAARWDADAALWRLTAADGRSVSARLLVAATGGLHLPAFPQIPGRESFAGPSFHSSQWRHDVDLMGRKVVVIGCGASAVQFIPEIAPRVAELKVLQRTPNWIVARPDLAIPPGVRAVFAALPWLRQLFRASIFVQMETLSFGLTHPKSAFWARALARRNLNSHVADPVLREKLRPHYPMGCKRVLLSSDYYPALTRPNVELVTTPATAIEAAGVRLADGRLLSADVLIFGTGFRPMEVLSEVDIRGRDGHTLAHDWQRRPQTYCGISTHGYPNLSFLLGPNTALGHNSVLYMIESQVRHVLALLSELKTRGARSVEPTLAAQQAFMQGLDRRFIGTAWAGCKSWYRNADGDNLALWVGSAMAYRRLARKVRAADYEFS